MNKLDIKEIDSYRKATHLSIPLEFVDDERFNFTPIELLLIANISSFLAPKYCFASNEYFAAKFKVSVPTISRAINRLIEMKCVELISFNGRVRTIACHIDTEFKGRKKRA